MPQLSPEHYEILGKITLSFSDKDELACKRIKDFFSNKDIFDYHDGKWTFHTPAFLEHYPTLADAQQALTIIENLKKHRQPKNTLEEKLEKLGWMETSTGGNCTAYYKVINKKEDTHFLMTEFEGLQKPERLNEMVTIGVYLDPENLTYTEAQIVCKLSDIVSGKIIFSSSVIE